MVLLLCLVTHWFFAVSVCMQNIAKHSIIIQRGNKCNLRLYVEQAKQIHDVHSTLHLNPTHVSGILNLLQKIEFTTKCKSIFPQCRNTFHARLWVAPWWWHVFHSAHHSVWYILISHVPLIRKQDQVPSKVELYTLCISQFQPDLALLRRRSQSSKCTLAQIWSVYTQNLTYHYSWKNMGTMADQ